MAARREGRVAALEDAGADEHAVHAELHHQRRIGRVATPPAAKMTTGSAPELGHLAHQIIRRANLLGIASSVLSSAHGSQAADFAEDRAGVAHGLDHVAGARFAFGADHRRAFADAAQRFAQVAAAAHEGHLEVVLVDVVSRRPA